MKSFKKLKKRKILFIGLIGLFLFSIAYISYQQITIHEMGLQVLSWVKKAKGNSVDLSKINRESSPPVGHQLWTDLLGRYVSEKGNVDYEGFLRDSASLTAYLTQISNHPPANNWSEAEKLAYWINAYNAFTVKLILDHYPLKSIKDIGGGLPMINSPWDIPFFNIGKTPFDLNTIEHEILRKQFDEPRIHFAMNCASLSCPKLRNEAFTAQKLESQLEDQAKAFLNDPDKNIITDESIQLSKIFDWFKKDFTQRMDLLAFIQQYRPDLNRELKLEFLDYNWSLNE